MNKFYTYFLYLMASSFLFTSCSRFENESYEEHEGYDGPAQRDSLEAMKLRDPSLGYVPYDRLFDAINYTQNLKSGLPTARLQQAVLWEERGPSFDSVGPGANPRAGHNFTSGRMRAVLIDTLNDPSGNTAICGGVSGGLWRCNNLLSTIPNWQPLTDYFDNIAIASICQDPTNPLIMYFATGEATSNADAVFGKGVWKSVNAGFTWSLLPATSNFIRNFKIVCDNAGTVYLAARTTTFPAVQTNGLMRSKDGGTTWENITPALVGTAAATATCTDIELSSTGKLYASFGYFGTVVRSYVTSSPVTVSPTAGWTLGTGIRTSSVAASRMELATLADTAYAVVVSAATSSVDSCYKSTDGGVNWTKQNTTLIPGGLSNGQGWYNLTLAINPANANDIMSGGLDAYRSANGGATWTRATNWVSTAPYVHADHHFMEWTNKNGVSKIVIGCDGGLFLTTDDGLTWNDKNRNLRLKQFYAAAIHPAAASPYLLAGAQDNGCHNLNYPGLGPSVEVTGGDGCFVHINQLDPQIQFGSYVYNQYRRSTNGGQTWTSINFSVTQGLFVNPFDYDDASNTMYASNGSAQMRRWPNAAVSNASTILPLAALGTGNSTAFKVSPYTPNRVFIGSSNGRVLRLENANSVTGTDITTSITNITGASFQAGFVNCINTGTSDSTLVAVMTNYGINNVWYSTNAGTTWSAIDGNLPDMPVRWAMFEPGRNDRMFLATEAGIYSTDLINGTSTVWMPNTTFPTVRTNMLKLRSSDSTIVAATHGRGLFTAKVSAITAPQVTFLLPSTSIVEQTSGITGCRNYTDYTINIGLVNAASGATTVTMTGQGGPAQQGKDWELTTNGSFTNPSVSLTFESGTTGVKPVTVRVYDDAEVEPIETITLGYSISGSTNALAGIITTHVINIADNDRAPISFATKGYTVGTFNTDVTSLSTPFDGTKLKHRLQVLYTAAELKAAGITEAATLSSLILKVKTKNTTLPFKGFTISIAATKVTAVNTGFVAGVVYIPVFSGDYATVAGDNTFAFSTPFVWDGMSNVVIQFCYDNSGTVAEMVTDVVEGTAAPHGPGNRVSTYSNWTTSTLPGCSLAAAFISDLRVTGTFAATFGDTVATAVNSTKTEYLSFRSNLFYYTPKHELLARVVNLSDIDYGCTQVIVDRAGTGSSQFWNYNGANYLMNKTFKIIPSTNNATGRSEVTFYFTKAEKEGWEAATGKAWSDIQIIKVPSAINSVTPLNAQPDGPGTVQVMNTVNRTAGPDFYTLTATFENGFGAYGFGVAGRIHTILTLTGKPAANRGIDLTWTTSAEVNSTTFEIQKSYDSINFRTIGAVQATGNKLSPSSYSFTDPENVQANYYRIKMLHSDGYVLFSNVIYVENDKAVQHLFVSPNPFSDNLIIRFGRTPVGSLTFTLYDASGRLLRRLPAMGGAAVYRINAIGYLPRGIYFLKVNVNGQQLTERVLKQ